MKPPQPMIKLMSARTAKPTDAPHLASSPVMRPTASAPRVPTLSKDTRPCNQLRPVDWLTREVA
jgi:hypothetical protein